MFERDHENNRLKCIIHFEKNKSICIIPVME